MDKGRNMWNADIASGPFKTKQFLVAYIVKKWSHAKRVSNTLDTHVDFFAMDPESWPLKI